MGEIMKVLIIGDLHGRMPVIRRKDFDILIAPGDICGDHGIREAFQVVYKKYIKNPAHIDPWWEVYGKKKAKQHVLDSVKRGRNILKYLNSFNKPVFVVPGNWDWTYAPKKDYAESWAVLNHDYWSQIKTGLKNIRDIDGKYVAYKDIQFVGYGKCNGPELLKHRQVKNIPKERYKRNEAAYKLLVKQYSLLFKKTQKNARAKNKTSKTTIFLTHNVPFNTTLDKIKNPKSLMNGKHYGSNLARDMIDKFHPPLVIGAHMHEHFGKQQLGKTLIINAGFGPKKNTFIELVDGKIKELQFYK